MFGFFILGKPLSCICQGAAIFTLAIGAFRTWRSQNAIVRGKAISGGFEIVSLAAGMFTVSNPTLELTHDTCRILTPQPKILLLLFVLVIAVDIEKENVTSHITLLLHQLGSSSNRGASGNIPEGVGRAVLITD
jgi:hypothetical protein